MSLGPLGQGLRPLQCVLQAEAQLPHSRMSY